MWDTAKMRLFGVMTRHQRLICLSGGDGFIVALTVTISGPGIAVVNARKWQLTPLLALVYNQCELAQIPFSRTPARWSAYIERRYSAGWTKG
jgi:hypothetical protein